MICTSTWRAASTKCSRKTVGSPKASSASPRADARAVSRSVGDRTTRIPRPPPPAVALRTTGYPSCSAWAAASSTVSTGPPPHGSDRHVGLLGQPLGGDLVAERPDGGAVGPTKTMPASSQRCAKDARSDTKPQPTHTASHDASRQRRHHRRFVEVASTCGARRGGRGRSPDRGGPPRRPPGRTRRRRRDRCRARPW